MTTAPLQRVAQLTAGLRSELRERRDARRAYLELERQLSSYRTRREVDDLLVTMADVDDPDAEQVRELLLSNLRPTRELFRAA